MQEQSDQVYVDLLEEDKPISGQKFVCVSFVSPEKILKQKELYKFEKFTSTWDFVKSMDQFQSFLNFVSYKYNIPSDTLGEEYKEFIKDEGHKMKVNSTIEDDYKNFIDVKCDELEKQFNTEHKFQTSTRGVKIRGVYSTQEEAEMRCKSLREVDANHDVYVGPVGLWMPWEPDAYKTGRVEYLETELNQLMHEKAKNEDSAKVEFDKRVKEAKENAIEENIKLAEKSGNTLTQTIKEDGTLLNVREVNYDEIPDESVVMDPKASTDARRQLFENHNVDTSMVTHQ